MSLPKTLFKKCWWQPEGTGSSQDTQPTAPTDAQLMGTVLTVSGARENEEAIFETPVFRNGTGEQQRWVDRDAINQRDRVIITVTCNELTPYFFERVEATSGPYAGQPPNIAFTAGKCVTQRGWFWMRTYDNANVQIHATVKWCKLDVESWEYPQTGYVNATFTLRVLDSAFNQGGFQQF
jgi:hypothetical protein